MGQPVNGVVFVRFLDIKEKYNIFKKHKNNTLKPFIFLVYHEI